MATTVASRADRLGGAAWMVLGLCMLVGAWRMDRFESMGANLYSAPGLVPGLYGLVMLLLGGLLAWRGMQAGAAAQAAPQPLLNRRVALMLLLSLAYAALAVGRLHFGLSTALFVAVFCWLFNDQAAPARRAVAALLAGVLTAVVVVLVFERIFLVRLP